MQAPRSQLSSPKEGSLKPRTFSPTGLGDVNGGATRPFVRPMRLGSEAPAASAPRFGRRTEQQSASGCAAVSGIAQRVTGTLGIQRDHASRAVRPLLSVAKVTPRSRVRRFGAAARAVGRRPRAARCSGRRAAAAGQPLCVCHPRAAVGSERVHATPTHKARHAVDADPNAGPRIA